MNVLRMVKLFGWENKMNERIRVKREEELVWVRWKQFLDVRPCFFRLLHAQFCLHVIRSFSVAQ